MTRLSNPAVPRLPNSADAYDRLAQEQYSNVLRLYFQQLNSVLGFVVGPNGGQYVDCPNGLFFNTVDQTFALANTAYPVVFDNTYLSNAVAFAGDSASKIAVSVNGVYNFQYTGQVYSSNSSAKSIYMWLNRNGTDIGYSTRAKTVSGNSTYTDISWNFDIDLQAGDYIELRVSVTNTGLKLDAQPSSAPHPGIPSSVLTVNFVAPLPAILPTPPSP